MKYSQAIKHREFLIQERKKAREEAEVDEKRFTAEILKVSEELRLNASNLDPERIFAAEHIVVVRGDPTLGGARDSCIQDALKFIAIGPTAFTSPYMDLYRHFYGTKNYDGFIGQRCDCKYDFGPRHGTTVFSVGLTEEVRRREGGWDALTEQEKEDALWYLQNYQQIFEARQKAKQQVESYG